MRQLARRPLRTVAATSVALAATLPLAAASSASAATAPTGSVRLHKTVLAGLAGLHSLRDTAPDTRVQVDLTLARPDRTGEAVLEHDLYTPGSRQFHRFLSPSAYASRFGVARTTAAATRTFATAHGLGVASVSATRDVWVLTGTAAQVEQTFAVHLKDFSSAGRTFYANTDEPSVPAALPVTGVIGLNSLLGSHTFHAKPAATAPHGATPAQDNCPGSGQCIGLTTPQDLWSIYHQPASDMGEGQKMAIFGEGQTDPVIANLRTFESLHKLRRIPVTVQHTDGSAADYSDNSGEPEWDLDTQASTGMSPNALGETLYFGHDLSDASTLSVLSFWVADASAPLQASASYGECEENEASAAGANLPPTNPGYAGSAGAMYTKAYEGQLQMAVNTGKTLFASTGDTGSSCPVVVAPVVGAGNGVLNQGFPVDNYPASSPHVVAVGGTVLYGTDTTGTTASPQRSLEYPWTFTGGGTSDVFARPAYQSGISVVTIPCRINVDGTPRTDGAICRGAPDVAAQSGDVASNGYGIVSQGQTNFPGGGTSLSSPLTMGMWTRVQAASTSGGNGFANATYYGQATTSAATDARDFFDVGGTTNSQPGMSQPSGNGFYTALPRSVADPTGYDYVSGLGVPDITNLTQDVDGTTTPLHPALPDEAPLPGTGGGGGTTAEPACVPLFTDPKGDDAYAGDPNGGSNPQLDIIQGDMHVVQLADGTPALQTVTTINDLSKTMAFAAGAANDYYFLWTYKNVQYFTVAEVDTTTGAVTYKHGTVSGNMFSTAANTSKDTGSFNQGPGGTVVVNTPLAGIGSVAPGGTLTAPAAQTRVLAGTTATGGLIEQADLGGPGNNFTLGEVCSATGKAGSNGGAGSPSPALPEVPVAALLPIAGLLVATGVLSRRRRRTTRSAG